MWVHLKKSASLAITGIDHSPHRLSCGAFRVRPDLRSLVGESGRDGCEVGGASICRQIHSGSGGIAMNDFIGVNRATITYPDTMSRIIPEESESGATIYSVVSHRSGRRSYGTPAT
jgi:hypothetical protein